MTASFLIKGATLVNEGRVNEADLLIQQGRIQQIAPTITAPRGTQIVEATGKYLLPGLIDDQVHFREPGFPSKGNIASESRAAVAGGITSFMEMPNVNPPTITRQALEDKYVRAAASSVANYSFYLGATADNLDEIQRLQPGQTCGIKIFMGASTGDLLVDNESNLRKIFAGTPLLVATHCEDTPTIQAAEAAFYQRYGHAIPPQAHAEIRSTEACLRSSRLAVSLAQQYGTRLHLLHLTTADELVLLTPAMTLDDLRSKTITAEVCVHHLFFNQQDYQRLGHQIKCNPSIKAAHHQQALLVGLQTGILDIIATDHAPHTWEEKQQPYLKAPSGLPLVQHALLMLLEYYHRGQLSLELIVQKTSHAVAERFQVIDRGYLREGFWADLVLVDLQQPTQVRASELLYHCGWSPLTGETFHSTIDTTWVNGVMVYQQGKLTGQQPGQRLSFRC
ncbi:MAG: dihydroorotase [Candidatus Symbiodolus clandestinus]